MMVSTTKILVLLLPLLVMISFVAGWIDGKIRFRKIKNSQILMRKILYASFLFIISITLPFIVWIGVFDTVGVTLGAILLGAASVVLVFLLGEWFPEKDFYSKPPKLYASYCLRRKL